MRRPGISDVDRRDVSWALDGLGRFIVQDGQFGSAVYRVGHQSLTEYLHPPFAPTAEVVFDPEAVPVADALWGRYGQLLGAGISPTSPGYLWQYAWRHAAAAGPAGLTLLRRLSGQAGQLQPDIAMAVLTVADTYGVWGRRAESLPPTQAAVQVYRGLAADNPASTPDLAGALNNLGNRLADLGRRAEALPPTQEAVHAYRGLAADNPAFTPNLASALNNLGNRLAELGRRAEALAPTQEAIDLYLECPGFPGQEAPLRWRQNWKGRY